MSSFKLYPLLLIACSLSLLGCGKKADLYHPEIDKGDTQSDQAFIFPPKRAEDATPERKP